MGMWYVDFMSYVNVSMDYLVILTEFIIYKTKN